MKTTVVNLFGNRNSEGTFDDFFDPEKYSSYEKAKENHDFVICDFVKDDEGILYISAHHVAYPENKFLHKLMYQNCPAGLDVSDDAAGANLASKLFIK